MPLTPEQKDVVRKRTTDYLGLGYSTVDAVNMAFEEVLGAEGAKAELSKTERLGSDVYKKPDLKMASLTEEKQRKQLTQAKTAAAELRSGEAKYATERAVELEALGVPAPEAYQKAKSEYITAFEKPVLQKKFGDFAEKAPTADMFGFGPKLPQAAPATVLPQRKSTLAEALRPQTFLPQSEVEKTTKETGASVPPIDAQKIREKMKEGGIGDDVINEQMPGLIKVIERVSSENPQLRPDDAVSFAFKQISAIPLVISNKATYIKEPETGEQLDKKLEVEPSLYKLAFEKQRKAGEGVPNFNQYQVAYLSAIVDEKRNNRYKQLKEEYKNKPLTETEMVPGPGGVEKAVTKTYVGVEKDELLKKRANAEVKKDWYIDEKQKSLVLQDPEKYKTTGILEEKTPFGGTRETTAGWLLRDMMAPWNAMAGFLSPLLFEGSPTFDIIPGSTGRGAKTQADIEEAKRARRPEMYKDHPVLYNIAEGRGFIGEAIEAADIMELEGPAKYAYLGGAFAADMLDPTFDAIGALGKGTKEAKQTYSATKALGLKGDLFDAARRGAAVAGEDFMKSWAATSVLPSGGKGVLGKTLFQPGDLRTFVADKAMQETKAADAAAVALKNGTSVEDALRGSDTVFAKEWKTAAGADDAQKFANVMAGDKIISNGMQTAKKFDNFVSGVAGVALTDNQVLRTLGSVAATDANIASKVAAGGTKDALLDLVKTDDVIKNAVRDRAVYETVLTDVYKNTKEMNAANDFVRVTKNTWATVPETKKIIKRFNETPLGGVAIELRSAPTIFSKEAFGASRAAVGRKGLLSERKVGAFFQVTEEQKNVIQKVINEQRIYGKSIDAFPWAEEGGKSYVSAKELRRAIDNNIDLIAAATPNAMSAAQIKKLAPRQALDVTKPLELKSGTRQVMSDAIDKFASFKDVQKSNLKLSPTGRELVNDVTGRLSRLDMKLRNDVRKMMNDTAFRKAVTGSDAAITRSEALAHLTVMRPIEKTSPALIKQFISSGAGGIDKNVKAVLKSAADNMFLQRGYKENIFDVFSGFDTSKVNDIWSEVARSKVDDIINNHVAEVIAKPETLWSEMMKMHDELKVIANDSKNLAIGAPVTDIIANAGGKIPPELQVGSYYRAEAARAVDDAMGAIVEKEIGNFKRAYDELAPAYQAQFKDAVTKRLQNISTGQDLLKAETDLSTNDVFKYFVGGGPIGGPSKSLPIGFNIRDPEAVKFITVVDEVAGNIAETYDIKKMTDPTDKIKDIVRTLDDPNNFEKAKLVLGEDVANQLKSAFKESGGSQIEENIKKTLQSLSDETTTEKRLRQANGIFDWVNSAWYTLILNTAPRFHFGNIIGAPALAYATTGMVIGPRDITDAIRITARAGGKAGNDIVFTDKFGRSYTRNELWEAFSTGTGASVQSLGLPSADAAAVASMLDDGKLGAAGRLWTTIIKESPTTEDVVTRMAVGLKAMKEGRSLEEGVALGKAALFNAGDITAAEKPLQRGTQFYSFARNNLVNLLKNLQSPEGWKRITKIANAKRGIESIAGITPEQQKFSPESASARVIFSLVKDKDGNELYVASAPDATLGALDTFSKLLAGDYIDVATGLANRETKMLLGLEEGKEYTEVPAEHLFWLTPGMIDSLAGEPVRPITTPNGDVKYLLTSPSARKTYSDRIAVFNFIGAMRFINDWANIAGAPGTKVDKSDISKLSYLFNMQTPLKSLPPEIQRARNVIDANAEAKKAITALSDANNAALKGIAKPTVEDISAQKVRQKVAEVKAEVKAAPASASAISEGKVPGATERSKDQLINEQLALSKEMRQLMTDFTIPAEVKIQRREQIIRKMEVNATILQAMERK